MECAIESKKKLSQLVPPNGFDNVRFSHCSEFNMAHEDPCHLFEVLINNGFLCWDVLEVSRNKIKAW